MLFRSRLLDLICGLAFVFVFCWLYVIVAVLVKIKLGSPIIFRQNRPGKDEKIFKLYKFRTMTDAKDDKGMLFPDEDRLTKFGNILRTTSLDELPEIFNIIKGDMSFVGPRPLLEKYLPFYTEREKKRHCVRPGLTGLAQINGRNNLGWDERLKMDIKYVSKITFRKDVSILLKTIVKVLGKSDIASGNQLIMEDLDVERYKTNNL